MRRRDFLLSSAAAAGTLALRGAAAPAPSETDELLRELVRANNAQIAGLLARQTRRDGHRWRGGLPNEHGIHTAHGAAGFVSALACAFVAPGSVYAGKSDLLEPLRLAADYLVAAQHEDGTIDLVTTNFHSPPDLGFVLETLCPAYLILRDRGGPGAAPVLDPLATFIRRGAEALTTGGVHTPNHRWVVSAALAWAHSLLPDPRYVARIDQWLAEGIDIDPDGQYTEKSTTVYSPVVDRALITVSRLLQRPALLDPVRRNLEMTLYYIHPDGEVVTEASRRQDRYQRGSMAKYYYSYRWLALHDGDRRFAALARQVERTARKQIVELPAFLAEPELLRPLPPDAPLPTDYAKVFAHSGLARIRRGATSATILAGNTTVFSLRKGPAALEAVRIATAFFGKGQFEGAKLEVGTDGRYLLRQTLEGPYFQPLSAEQIAKGDHVRMAPNGTLAANSKALRTQSNVQRLASTVEVREEAGRFMLAISIAGTAGVPVAVELAFRHGGTLEGVEPIKGAKDSYLLRGGMGRYIVEGSAIEFGPGQVEHTYTEIRGALPKWDGRSVYITGLTPFERTLALG